jgi:outer membrane lipoprotein carrier protein
MGSGCDNPHLHHGLLGLALLTLYLACAIMSPPAVHAQEDLPGPGIERLVSRVQGRLSETADLQARFIQRRLTRFGSVIVERTGKLYIQPPGRMRWEYEQPADLWVSAGEEGYFFQPDDNQVQVYQTGDSEASELPIMYLAGKGDLLRDFDIEETNWGPKLSPGNIQLSLLPHREDASFTMLVLEVEPMSATLVRLVQIDRINNAIDYQFHDIEYDVGLADSLFEFEIPPGADVIHIGG